MGQEQLDTRALEKASMLEGQIIGWREVLSRHLDTCDRRAEEASAHRASFRIEVQEMFKQFQSNSDRQHTENRASQWRMLWSGIAGMGTTILLLLSLAGYLFAKANGW